jgi:hypothetical protein
VRGLLHGSCATTRGNPAVFTRLELDVLAIPALQAEMSVTSASEVQQADGDTICAPFEPRDAAAYHRHRQ